MEGRGEILMALTLIIAAFIVFLIYYALSMDKKRFQMILLFYSNPVMSDSIYEDAKTDKDHLEAHKKNVSILTSFIEKPTQKLLSETDKVGIENLQQSLNQIDTQQVALEDLRRQLKEERQLNYTLSLKLEQYENSQQKDAKD